MIGFFIGFLTVVLAIACLLLVLLVLMQRPKQEGLGAAFGGGMTDQMFGAQTTNVLQRATVYLAVMFFTLTMALAILIGVEQKSQLSKEDEALATSSVDETPTGSSVGSPTAPPIDLDAGSAAKLIENLPGLIPDTDKPAPAVETPATTPEATPEPESTPEPTPEPTPTPANP